MEPTLQGRRVAVTGAAGGIGSAIIDRLLREGAEVIGLDLRGLDRLPSDVATVEVDLSSAESIAAAVAEVYRDDDRPIDLVTSAGIAGPNHKTWEYPLEDWAKVMKLNVDGTLHCCRSVIPGMVKRNYGRIVLVASIAGKEGNPNASAYSASKAAVIALTKSLGKELADKDIAVNCITPAAARTRIFDQMSEEHIGYMLAKIPRGRFLLPDEVASMVAFLASAENSFTTAGVFDLSGGRATY